ncbi:MAG: hypothetical protein QOK39_2062, partial [Acidimicrobiaceae bacterium]|nr:hypothetical protein [Acidimicrobiaceae bacterium]
PQPVVLRFQLTDTLLTSHTNLYMKTRGTWWILKP